MHSNYSMTNLFGHDSYRLITHPLLGFYLYYINITINSKSFSVIISDDAFYLHI
jgi:hypothetical protein